MQLLLSLLEQYGLAFVFFHVLAEQAGLPLPAYPTLIVAGALASRADYTVPQLVAAAVVAAVISDSAWYIAGSRLGRSVLRTLCRISLSPDSCVRQTEAIYLRFGAPSLLVAKFVPGFAAVATALAGSMRTRVGLFLLFDALGALLWAGVAVSLGVMFQDAVHDVLEVLEQFGKWGLIAIAAAFALFILLKWWQRKRFYAQLRMARVTVEELRTLIDQGAAPVILDVRAPLIQLQDGRIPSAIAIDHGSLEKSLAELSASGEVIVYCACPNEASAAVVAKQIIRQGYARVRPLEGGFDAWVAAGYAVERHTA
ncbi:MAG: DedA family protein/thiosulfate sulfurtransferase GlpE [Proteobacteria bacterium]|nr:DedA family protein/thiosulfate sulfurtransferase GlpE [Pseudomonadota bacterium]